MLPLFLGFARKDKLDEHKWSHSKGLVKERLKNFQEHKFSNCGILLFSSFFIV